MKLSVIIPAYNEEKNLASTINKCHDYLSAQKYDFEIIIVNDGSTDMTGQAAAGMSKDRPRIKLLENKINLGKGAAIRRGLLAGGGEYRLFIDADNATSIDHLAKVWPLFDSGCDIVIGTRNSKDAPGAYQAKPQSIWKRITGIIGNKVIRALAVGKIRDTQCGFKVFTAKAAKEIFSRTMIDRWATDVEILILARRLNYKIGIIPVVWYNNPDSRVKSKDYFLFLKDIIIAKYHLLTGKYD